MPFVLLEVALRLKPELASVELVSLSPRDIEMEEVGSLEDEVPANDAAISDISSSRLLSKLDIDNAALALEDIPPPAEPTPPSPIDIISCSTLFIVQTKEKLALNLQAVPKSENPAIIQECC
jgi:hypothetical protein